VLKKVLVANRGEVALRVIRALRELGIRSVSVHSTADTDALHVRFADETVCIGPPPSLKSYLNIPALISAAEITGADAIHPGYGFLSERAEFAEVAAKCGLTFIGPEPEAIRMMGDKVRARERMREAGLPILPGTGALSSEDEARAAAEEIGYPIILKAAAGGGGRGMKIVSEPGALGRALEAAGSEARAAFGNDQIYLERYVERPRHIEVQVIGDRHGNAVHLFERECSIQRRHQKLVEEAPSPALVNRPELRDKLLRSSVEAIKNIGYQSVGTIEFLMDERRGELYFMEMNTRIQVEHTVTEMVTGLDLVREQIRIASGEPLSFGQDDVEVSGWAIEVRVNAEDPVTFAPSPGRITALHKPGGPGIRIDTHVYAHYVVPPHYDSLLAKLIAADEDRPATIRRLRRALGEFIVEGIRTNLDLHRDIVDHPDFVEGRLDTAFLERLPRTSKSAS